MIIRQCLFLIFGALVCAQIQAQLAPTIHYTLQKRGGPAHLRHTADLDWLAAQLAAAEARFNTTRREVKGNKIVRVPKLQGLGGGEGGLRLTGEIGRFGGWFATLVLGASNQPVDMDIDMLTADFAVRSTTSQMGSKFDEFFSSSYAPSDQHPFPNCGLPNDQTLLPTIKSRFPLTFPHCKPMKQSRDTLLPSGAILGLAPSDSLKQIPTNSFIKQLLDLKVISSDIFSLTLINGWEGLLSIGGTAAESVQTIQDRIETFLGRSSGDTFSPDHVTDPARDQQDVANGAPAGIVGEVQKDHPEGAAEGTVERANSETPPAPDGQNNLKRDTEINGEMTAPLAKRNRGRVKGDHRTQGWRDQWSWSPVEGASGWWQTLMRGVWIDDSRILKNQPCVIDINTPFIMAPPLAAKAFYGSISGSRRLPPPYTNFYSYPCNNPPGIALEFGGWRFPVMRGMKSYDNSNGPNGKFSLGKVSEESGYCVGAVVETRIGVGDQAPIKARHSRKDDLARGLGSVEAGMVAGNGMRDVWILGEQAFRGLGVVFDMKSNEVGFRIY